MKYRVWIGQINQTYVDVKAENKAEAIEKAERKWRREEAGFRVIDVQAKEDECQTS